jgi:ABC-type branched-subunit amino acid transport system ATPase component
MTTTVQLSGLGKRYRAATALDDVSPELAAGRVYLLVGPDGAGKTTLLRVLADLARPTGGSVEILGRPSSVLQCPAQVVAACLGRLCRIVPGAGERGYLRFRGARECRDVHF